MKTLMALVLSLGMVLLGTAPVMAAGQLMAPKAAANLSAPVKALKPDPSLTQPAIPEPPVFRTMSDEDLISVQGEDGLSAVVGALSGAAAGAAESWLDTGKISGKEVLKGAAEGAAMNFIFPSGKLLKDGQVFGRLGTVIAKTAYASLKGIAGTVIDYTVNHTDKMLRWADNKVRSAYHWATGR